MIGCEIIFKEDDQLARSRSPRRTNSRRRGLSSAFGGLPRCHHLQSTGPLLDGIDINQQQSQTDLSPHDHLTFRSYR